MGALYNNIISNIYIVFRRSIDDGRFPRDMRIIVCSGIRFSRFRRNVRRRPSRENRIEDGADSCRRRTNSIVGYAFIINYIDF